jgi:hypothetical protein
MAVTITMRILASVSADVMGTRTLGTASIGGSDAFAEIRDVVVMDDERSGQHGLEGGREAFLRPPREVVVVVVALSPLRDSGDVIRVVLIGCDPDDFAAIVLKVSARISIRRLATSSPSPAGQRTRR